MKKLNISGVGGGMSYKSIIEFIIHKDDVENYPECETCTAKVCDDKCFEIHPGSIKAFEKVVGQEGQVRFKIVSDQTK